MARSKVKSRSHHDVAHLNPLTNVTTTYQLPTPYGFQDIARTRIFRSNLKFYSFIIFSLLINVVILLLKQIHQFLNPHTCF